jgi:20S proteasome subunit beta 1
MEREEQQRKRAPGGFLRQGQLLNLLLSLMVALTLAGSTNAVPAETISQSSPIQPISMGTTLVAIKYRGGVVVGADSRTSVSGYVSHRFAHKIAPLTDHTVLLRSGSAADTQQIAESARMTFLHRRYRCGIVPTVSQVAHWIRSTVYEESTEGVTFAVSGSGSTYVLGYLDHHVSGDLSENEAIELCQKAIELAIDRDGSSGGRFNIIVINGLGRRIVETPLESIVSETPVRVAGFASTSSPLKKKKNL